MSTENEIQVIESPTIGSTAMMFGANNLERAIKIAEAMATAKVSVPNHLRGNPGDCLAIVMQAAQWGMNPFAVAQKTHVVNGTLGYEAQLVNAVVQTSGAIVGSFNYEYQGQNDDIACRVGAVIKGDKDITWGEWLWAKHVTTKNSPLWKTNTKQQLGYLQVKNWARQYCPGAILGVYSEDEFEPPASKDMGNIDRKTGEVTHAPRAELPPYADDAIESNIGAWKGVVESGRKTVDGLIAFLKTKNTLTAEQEQWIRADVTETAPIDAEFVESYSEKEA